MKIKLEFSVEEVNLIIQGLGEIPAKLSMNLIQRIQDEATEQLQPKPQPQLEDGNLSSD